MSSLRAGTYARVGWRRPYHKDVELLKQAAVNAGLDRKVVFDALRGVQRAKLPVLLPRRRLSEFKMILFMALAAHKTSS